MQISAFPFLFKSQTRRRDLINGWAGQGQRDMRQFLYARKNILVSSRVSAPGFRQQQGASSSSLHPNSGPMQQVLLRGRLVSLMQ